METLEINQELNQIDIKLRTYNYFCKLNPESQQLLKMAMTKLNLSARAYDLEDVRLFRWEKQLYASGVRRDVKENGEGRIELCKLDVTPDGVIEATRDRVEVDPHTHLEKNWMPILDMPFHFVRWCNPCEVVKFDIKTNTTTTVHLTPESNVIPRSEISRDLRGGTQVYPIGEGRRMTLTHEVDLNKDAFGRKDGHYNHRVLIWDKDWNLEKWTSDFHFLGTQIDPTTGQEYNIEFATGNDIP